VRLFVPVTGIKEATSHNTKEVTIMLSCKGEERHLPFILEGERNGVMIGPVIYLPWVNTGNPSEAFVPFLL